MELHPFLWKCFFCRIPAHEIRLRDNVDLGAFCAASGTAVVMPTAQRRIVCHDIQGDNIRHKVGLNIIVIPVISLLLCAVVYIAIDDYAVVIADGKFLIEEPLHGRA